MKIGDLYKKYIIGVMVALAVFGVTMGFIFIHDFSSLPELDGTCYIEDDHVVYVLYDARDFDVVLKKYFYPEDDVPLKMVYDWCEEELSITNIMYYSDMKSRLNKYLNDTVVYNEEVYEKIKKHEEHMTWTAKGLVVFLIILVPSLFLESLIENRREKKGVFYGRPPDTSVSGMR